MNFKAVKIIGLLAITLFFGGLVLVQTADAASCCVVYDASGDNFTTSDSNSEADCLSSHEGEDVMFSEGTSCAEFTADETNAASSQETNPGSALEKEDTACCSDADQKANRVCLCNPLSVDGSEPTDLIVLIGRISKFLALMVGMVAFLFFVVGGIYWIFSAGNEERIKRGRDMMMWSVIGTIITFASYAILAFIFRALSIITPAV
ncbi:MAG: pilin [Patescibacteria group bacterium]|jgi:hypothetical protein